MNTAPWADLTAIKAERAGAIVQVRLNRPKAVNAINSTLETEFYRVLKDCDADNTVKCVVLTAEGANFSAGHDIRQLAEETMTGATPPTIDGKHWVRTGELLPPWWFTKALVVAVKGYVGPHANTFLLAADVVVAADNTKFSWEETRVGIGAPFGVYATMPFHFPMRVVKHLWMTGGWMDAETAKQLFYVNRVVPLGEEEALAMRFAEQLAKMELGNLVANKRGIHKSYQAAGLLNMVDIGRDAYVHGPAEQEALLHHMKLIYEKGAGAAARSRDDGIDPGLTKV
jgi:enoyl-CoA hydratase/carnithine racemase